MKLFRVMLSLSFALSAVAYADERLVIAPFSGPKATVARGQLLKSVCEEVECLPVTEATTRGKLDPRKIRREQVTGILTGKVTGRRIDIRLLRKVGGKPVFKKVYPVRAGRLSAAALDDITGRVSDALGGGTSADDSAPVASGDGDGEEEEADTGMDAPVARPSASAASGAGSVASDETDTGASASDGAPEFSDPDTETDAVATEAAPTAGMAGTPSLFSAQVGVDFLSRTFTIQGLRTGQLRDYNLALFPAPRVRVQATPFANNPGPTAGIGAEADFTFMVGLKSQVAAGSTFPTSMSRIDVGALYNFRPLKDSPLILIPRVGYRLQSFAVKAAADGAVLDGLPGVSYNGLRVGAGVEHLVAQSRVRLFADLGFLPSLSTGQIGQEPFFPGSKATGIEVGGGLGYMLTPKVELRGSAQLTSYSVKFVVPENGQYAADGASDRYVGGQVGARYLF